MIKIKITAQLVPQLITHVGDSGVIVKPPMCLAKLDYLIGQTPPRYPVPAIILDTTIRPMGVAIWRCYDGLDGDRYTKEFVHWFKPMN